MFSSGFTAIELDDLLIDYEVNSAVAVATAYLEEATYASYFYEESDFEQMSVESIPDDEKVILTQEISDYSEFRTTLKAVPYSDTKLTSASMTSIRSDEVSGSVFFDTVGDWKVVVMGTNLPTYTYMIRIV